MPALPATSSWNNMQQNQFCQSQPQQNPHFGQNFAYRQPNSQVYTTESQYNQPFLSVTTAQYSVYPQNLQYYTNAPQQTIPSTAVSNISSSYTNFVPNT